MGSEEPKSKAVFVPGFGCKGEGKAANYGVAIPMPSLLPQPVCPPAQGQPSSSSGLTEAATSPAEPSIPVPIPATTELVEDWVTSHFRKLTNISTKCPPEKGESVLWRGVKLGKSGGSSTKIEYFNGKVRDVKVEDGEIYVYID